MSNYTDRAGLKVDIELVEFVENEALPGLAISADAFWNSMANVVSDLTPINIDLLEKREIIQQKIDRWNSDHQGRFDAKAYKSFLQDIGYLVDEGEPFSVTTSNVDDEIAHQAGAQLVVPTSNARFALNATNARWGSLYDALYGTDVISDEGGAQKTASYNKVRGDKVIEFGRQFLDKNFPLKAGSHFDATNYAIENGALKVLLVNDTSTELASSSQLIGFDGDSSNSNSILLKNNGLHIVIEIDSTSPVGSTDKAGIKDITMEAALTAIQDFEDSVAAVDAEDKVGVYRNWLGLMKGDLTDTFIKSGQQMTRELAYDRVFNSVDGKKLTVHGRSLLFCRNVGHLMSNPAIIDSSGREIQEGILDAMLSILIAKHDIEGENDRKNSRKGSIYIVKPKMHGPEEVAFANTLFNRVEDELGLTRHTVKIGVMDEERRTTVNLKECIRQVKDRVVFINTGFLDRTGDEIHTSMLLGAMSQKSEIKAQPWISAYEDWNVDIGLECGLAGKAQIGKGMWAMPDEMAKMLDQKIGHPKSGANTAWVPSPIGATLHATHYHEVDVFAVQKTLSKRSRASLDSILTIPLCDDVESLTAEQIQAELDNNVQGILGYVVRWIDQGVGCSKVPDINNVGLMEDRATLRISSQHIANWLEHKVTNVEQVNETFQRMAQVVDNQNLDDPKYKPMFNNFDGSLAYQAALELVLKGKDQPSGYTEPLLHSYRLKLKATG
ncbi:malate synthase G [Arenicella sp. 4NH20-0111]|uniref:malate synthase G n=1 Tax=Arenicella sp. 4NH20-0111 TaxID=3127648 RepID=UPI0031061385